jgi:hypothetical protein
MLKVASVCLRCLINSLLEASIREGGMFGFIIDVNEESDLHSSSMYSSRSNREIEDATKYIENVYLYEKSIRMQEK